MENMKKKILELNKLISENPDFPVKLFVGSDELSDDDFYTSHEIVSVELSKW